MNKDVEKIRFNKCDNNIYSILLKHNNEDIKKFLTTDQQESNIYKNYFSFYDLIEKYVNEKGHNSEKLIIDALKKLTIVELEIQQEKPQEIFESINSTGRELTTVDLIRNYLLMQLPYKDQEKLYDDYWSEIEETIGLDYMEQLMVDYLILKKQSNTISINKSVIHINSRTLYTTFKYYYQTKLEGETCYEKTLNCFKELKKFAMLYKDFIYFKDINLNKQSQIKKKLYFLKEIKTIGTRGCSGVYSLLLYIFNLHNNSEIDDNMLSEAVDGIVSLVFRAKVCKYTGINRQFASNMISKLSKIKDYGTFSDSFWKAITSGKRALAFPNDEVFKKAIVNKDIYNTFYSNGTKHILYMIELHSPFSKELPPINSDDLQVEHIMPQKLNPDWKDYLSSETIQNYNNLLHRLGNLALTSYNKKLSNNNFDRKKEEVYKNSGFYYTKDICKYNEWQIDSINKRTVALTKKLLSIFKLPNNYQNEEIESSNLHDLMEDPEQFKFKKLSSLIIGDETYLIKNWSDFLPTLCKHLYNEDPELFENISKLENNKLFFINKNNNINLDKEKYSIIFNNTYVCQYKSAPYTIKRALEIVQKYDEIAGTEHENDVLFSTN